MNSQLIRKAIKYSMEKHAHQKRLKNDYPYIVHPISVFSIVKKYKESTNADILLCAALLHDVIEDTDTSYDELSFEFSKEIADVVYELTNDETAISKTSKTEYMKDKLQKMSSYALVIKLADMLDNVTDEPNQKQLDRYYDLVQNVKISRKLTQTHNALIKELDYVFNTKLSAMKGDFL